jgi:ATP-dependent DNA helicase RecQ
MKPVTAFNSLKILERDGYITLDDVWDDPSRIFFSCSKEDLYRYQVENTDADKVLRIILRSYSGVFTDFTRISENEIARRSGIDSPKVNELLIKMQKNGIIDYLPHKNSPQLIFNTERLKKPLLCWRVLSGLQPPKLIAAAECLFLILVRKIRRTAKFVIFALKENVAQ